MSRDEDTKKHKSSSEYSKQVGKIESRKLKAREESLQTIWSGFAMFGLIGWSVTVPTLLGVALGIWLDRHYPIVDSWTLTLLIVGLFIGCLNAWHWVSKEERKIRKGRGKKDE